MDKKCYYEILQISKNADSEEIKRSYRKLAIKFHPDKNPGDSTAEARFREIADAYSILSDPDKRAAYDRYGHSAFQGNVGHGFSSNMNDPFNLFKEMFSGGSGSTGGFFEHFFSGGMDSSNDKGTDLLYNLKITLEEAFNGCEKEIELRKLEACDTCKGSGKTHDGKVIKCSMCNGNGQVVTSRGFFQIAQTCPRCHGAGKMIDKPCQDCRGDGRSMRTTHLKLNIPAGINEESRLRSVGNGEAGKHGEAAGDLYVAVHIDKHSIFTRDGHHLHCRMPIPFVIAALGGEIEVPTLGGPVQIKVPPGMQGAADFRVPGYGMPRMNSHSKGDLYIKFEVEVPTKLNHEQQEALQVFAALCGEENTPIHKSFTERIRDFFS